MSEKSSNTEFTSHDQAFRRFDDPNRSSYYPQEFSDNKSRTRRDRANIDRAMGYFTEGGHILDLPCGSGRLTAMLLDRGQKITAADSSQNMVDRAQAFIQEKFPEAAAESTFCVQDVLGTSFADKTFDGVICYRLFHHFHEQELRTNSLRELARISKGEIIVSMHTSTALSYLLIRLKKLFKGGRLSRSYPSLATFEQEIATAGLKVVDKLARRKWISPLWIYVLLPK